MRPKLLAIKVSASHLILVILRTSSQAGTGGHRQRDVT